VSDAPVVALIVSGSLLFAVHRVASAWEQVSEVKAKRAEPMPSAPNVPIPVEIPEDLIAVALQENEVWAQEELTRVIREKYEQYRDWNRVRMAMGLGRRD
jgi:hypothetical protein